MATVTVLNAAKTIDLINDGVTTAFIDENNHLILQKPEGVFVDVGKVIHEHNELVGLGEDDHEQYALADGSRGNFRAKTQAVINFNGGDENAVVETITVTDDGTSTSGWINRLVGYFKPSAMAVARLVFFLNEYLELRLAPAKHNTVALRIFVRDTAVSQTTARNQDVPLMELMDDRTNRNTLWGLYDGGAQRVKNIPVSYTIVLGASDPVPAGTPANTVIVRTA